MTARTFLRHLVQLRREIERLEDRKVEEIGLPEKTYKRVCEELAFEPKLGTTLLLNGVRVVDSFEYVVSFILEERPEKTPAGATR